MKNAPIYLAILVLFFAYFGINNSGKCNGKIVPFKSKIIGIEISGTYCEDEK